MKSALIWKHEYWRLKTKDATPKQTSTIELSEVHPTYYGIMYLGENPDGEFGEVIGTPQEVIQRLAKRYCMDTRQVHFSLHGSNLLGEISGGIASELKYFNSSQWKRLHSENNKQHT